MTESNVVWRFLFGIQKNPQKTNPKNPPKKPKKKKQPRTDLPWMLKVKLEVSVRGRVLKPISISN